VAAQTTVVSRQDLLDEINQKMDRVQQYLKNKNLDGILLTRLNNFAWITAGLGDSHILLSSENGAGSLLILKNGKKYLIAAQTEIPHLMDEEVKGLGYETLSYAWYNANGNNITELVASVADAKKIGSDIQLNGLQLLDNDFNELRYTLTNSEITKYRWVCKQTAEAVVDVLKKIKPGMTEKEVETLTITELQRRQIRPTVVLIGSDERLQKYYHYPPQDKKIRKHVFVNVCARRWGMVTSVGRYAYFGPVPSDIKKNQETSAFICAYMDDATKAGKKVSDISKQVKQLYAQKGLPDEWKQIHYGGGIGYAEREYLITDASTEIIKDRQAFAWNPFTPAALSFDTILLIDGKIENLTYLAGFPEIDVKINGNIYRKPGILVR
jgi:Xaa-Pro aminopeptidase